MVEKIKYQPVFNKQASSHPLHHQHYKFLNLEIGALILISLSLALTLLLTLERRLQIPKHNCKIQVDFIQSSWPGAPHSVCEDVSMIFPIMEVKFSRSSLDDHVLNMRITAVSLEGIYGMYFL